MNWIHPFVDGNGRTSRAVSYLVLCVRLGYRLPGTTTIPEQISRNKDPYYQALEAADNANTSGKLDLTEMERLLESLLANQLVSVLDSARSGG
jgi:Fic family protein